MTLATHPVKLTTDLAGAVLPNPVGSGNSKPVPGSSGSSSRTQTPYMPRPPDCRTKRPSALDGAVIVSR